MATKSEHVLIGVLIIAVVVAALSNIVGDANAPAACAPLKLPEASCDNDLIVLANGNMVMIKADGYQNDSVSPRTAAGLLRPGFKDVRFVRKSDKDYAELHRKFIRDH